VPFSFHSDLREKYWSAVAWELGKAKLVIKNLMGKTAESVIRVKTELQKNAGDTTYFGVVGEAVGSPVHGDTEILGKEGYIPIYPGSVTIEQVAFMARLPSRFHRRLSSIELRRLVRDGTAQAVKEDIEKNIIEMLAGVTTAQLGSLGTAPTSGRHLYGGNATGAGDMDGNDWFGCYEIRRLIQAAKTLTPRFVRPRVAGRNMWVCMISPQMAAKLRNDSEWKNAQMYAALRGRGNELFSGGSLDYVGEYEGVLLLESEYIPNVGTDTGGNPIHRAVFCGAQAGAFALGGGPYPLADEASIYADAGRKPAYGLERDLGFKKVVVDSEDLATIVMDCSAAGLVATAHS